MFYWLDRCECRANNQYLNFHLYIILLYFLLREKKGRHATETGHGRDSDLKS